MNNSTINIKTSTALAIVGVILSGVMGWFMKEAYADYKRQNTKQWEKLGELKSEIHDLNIKINTLETMRASDHATR